MTRVDFYLLPEAGAEARARFACRLTEKAYRQGHRVYIRAADRDHAEALDRLLWTFRDGSFVPHARYPEAAEEDQPVLVGTALPERMDDVLLNLAGDRPEGFSRFRRLVEVVGPDAGERAAARERYRYYRDRGYPLATHDLARSRA